MLWFLSILLVDNGPGQRYPVQLIQLLNKIEDVCSPKFSGKFRKTIKLWKTLLIKIVSDYFSENSH